MKIKNKDRLVRRAEADRDAGRVVADHYLLADGAQEDGAQPFEGCLIGCLSVPTTKKARDEWLELDPDSDEMIDRIERDFGVCGGLQRVGEWFLMGLPQGSKSRLGGFLVSFAKALPEGADVDNALVNRWLESRGGHLQQPKPWRSPMIGGHIDSQDAGERKAFLDWMRRGCPEPRQRRAG